MAENHFTCGANKIISLDFSERPKGIDIDDVFYTNDGTGTFTNDALVALIGIVVVVVGAVVGEKLMK